MSSDLEPEPQNSTVPLPSWCQRQNNVLHGSSRLSHTCLVHSAWTCSHLESERRTDSRSVLAGAKGWRLWGTPNLSHLLLASWCLQRLARVHAACTWQVWQLSGDNAVNPNNVSVLSGQNRAQQQPGRLFWGRFPAPLLDCHSSTDSSSHLAGGVWRHPGLPKCHLI